MNEMKAKRKDKNGAETCENCDDENSQMSKYVLNMIIRKSNISSII